MGNITLLPNTTIAGAIWTVRCCAQSYETKYLESSVVQVQAAHQNCAEANCALLARIYGTGVEDYQKVEQHEHELQEHEQDHLEEQQGFFSETSYPDIVHLLHAFHRFTTSAAVFKAEEQAGADGVLGPEPRYRPAYSIRSGTLLGYERHASIILYKVDADVTLPASFFRSVVRFAVGEGLGDMEERRSDPIDRHRRPRVDGHVAAAGGSSRRGDEASRTPASLDAALRGGRRRLWVRTEIPPPDRRNGTNGESRQSPPGPAL